MRALPAARKRLRYVTATMPRLKKRFLVPRKEITRAGLARHGAQRAYVSAVFARSITTRQDCNVIPHLIELLLLYQCVKWLYPTIFPISTHLIAYALQAFSFSPNNSQINSFLNAVQ